MKIYILAHVNASWIEHHELVIIILNPFHDIFLSKYKPYDIWHDLHGYDLWTMILQHNAHEWTMIISFRANYDLWVFELIMIYEVLS